MEGVVLVERQTGALHFTRGFTRRFDVRHPKSERMNLGALFFALQSFAANSFHGSTSNATTPEIPLLETAQARIVLGQSRVHRLLILLFVRPSVRSEIAKATVERIAYHYDHESGLESHLAGVLQQNARLFRDACERALQDVVDDHLQHFISTSNVWETSSTSTAIDTRFLVLYYSPTAKYRQPRVELGYQVDEDDDDEDDMEDPPLGTLALQDDKVDDTQPATETSSTIPQNHRLQRVYASTRSLLSVPAARPHRPKSHKLKPSKNAVMDYAGPKTFHRLLTPNGTAGTSKVANVTPTDPADITHHPQFAIALVDTVQPFLKSIASFLFPRDSATGRRRDTKMIEEIEWKSFVLPRISTPVERPGAASTAPLPTTTNLRIWKRDGCMLVYSCVENPKATLGSSKQCAQDLFDVVEPLAQCVVRLRG